MSLRVVMLGDIVGTPGIRAVQQIVPTIRQEWRPDLIIANAENAANGSGLTPKLYQDLKDAGIDGMTLGDHAFRKGQIFKTLDSQLDICRPANLSTRAKGLPWMKLKVPDAPDLPPVFVITVLGRVYMDFPNSDPFAAVETLLLKHSAPRAVVIVEVHAEATAEKRAMGWHLDGRVAAVLGSHTHVPTADGEVLPKGTAYLTDLGMCGPHESVIGRDVDKVLRYMTTAMPAPFDVATGDPRVNGVSMVINERTGLATSIDRFTYKADVGKSPF